MRGDHKVRDVGLKGGARFDDFGPVRVVVVEGSLMVGWAAVVTFEFS